MSTCTYPASACPSPLIHVPLDATHVHASAVLAALPFTGADLGIVFAAGLGLLFLGIVLHVATWIHVSR